MEDERVYGLEFKKGDIVHDLLSNNLESSYVVWEYQDNNGINGSYWLIPNDPKIKTPWDTKKSTSSDEDDMVLMTTWNKLTTQEKLRFRTMCRSRYPDW